MEKLLKTKIQVPTINKNIISREKVLTKLQYARECRLTLVTAPAGYGKTTAVLDWIRKCGLASAWMSVDSNDNTPATFWKYVCAALESINKGISAAAQYVLASRELMEANIHLNILIDRLLKVSSDFLFVLDDLHLVNDPSILAGLSYLIDYLPEKMHLIFISRRLPDFGQARHSIKWQVQRLTEEDLRFGGEEIKRFYQARGITLENNELEKVESYTEGWVAAMVTVTLSMKGGGHDTIAALANHSRNINQYLRDEVIDTWTPEMQSFAVKTSILDTMTEERCNAVTGDHNGFRFLKEIYEKNGFLLDIDGQKKTYRYHYLFRNFLQELLSETYPDEILHLYTRAGLWFKEQSLMSEAIEHFLQGASFHEAFDLIEYQIDHLINKNEFDRLLSWIKRLPAGYRDNSFKIAVIYALYYAETGQYDLSRQWIDRMKTLKGSGKYASTQEWSGYSQTVCTMVESNLLVREGDIRFLPLLFSAAETDGGRFYKMPEYNDFNIADLYFYRCPINRLTMLFRESPQQYERMIESYRGMISVNPGYAPLSIGEYLYENNRLDEALPYLLRAVEEAREADCMGAFVPAMVNVARLKRACGEVTGAFAVLGECEKQLSGSEKAHWIYLLHAFRCRLFIDIGDTDSVKKWFLSSRLNIFTPLNRIREFELIIYARVLVFLNRTQDAQLLLQRLLAFTVDNRRLHSSVEVQNLLALLAFKSNCVLRGLRYLDDSVVIGMNEGYVRSFLDELSPMAQILRAYLKSRRQQPEGDYLKDRKAYAASLLKQMHGSLLQTLEADREVAEKINEKMAEQLTAQEKRVLELLVNGASNKEISDKLGISLRTVKTHTGNIYGKLGIKTRTQCIKAVRELELL